MVSVVAEQDRMKWIPQNTKFLKQEENLWVL